MIMAIDPGKNGGFAVKYCNGTIETKPMPETPLDIIQYINHAIVQDSDRFDSKKVCVLEQVGGYVGQKQPGSAMFVFGENYGFIQGALMIYGFKIVKITPQAWQKALSLGNKNGMSKKDWKNKLKSKAQELSPGVDVTLKTADALLILEAARRLRLDT